MQRLHRSVIPGGILFGAGWALTGACPSIARVQLGEGKLPAFATIAGILLGGWLYRVLNERYFHLDHAGCS